MSITGSVAVDHHRRGAWIPYATLLVLLWGVWGAFSSYPTVKYGYPDGMVYVIWSLTMIIPAVAAMRGHKFDRRPVAAMHGLVIGLAGAGGQLLLFKALTMGPAYIIFPIIAVSPAVTVVMALVLLRERLSKLSAVGVVLALAAVVLFSISSSEGDASGSTYLILAVLICIAWGVQAFFMRKAATVGVNDATTFGWMTIAGIALSPVAIMMMGGLPLDFPWQAPALTAVTQVLNAVGALFLVMAMSRGKASVVAPVTNALAPALTVVLNLVVLQTMPSKTGGLGILFALVGSTLMVYADEKRGEVESTPAFEPTVAEHPKPLQ